MNILPEYQYQPFFGLGSPSATRKHVRIIKALNFGVDKLLSKEYEAFSDCPIDENNLVSSLIPDIVVLKNGKGSDIDIPVMFIEVTTTSMYQKVKKKNIDLMEKFQIRESFIYDYEKYTWTKITDINPHKAKRSYSDMFNIDLDKLILNVKKL